ncbi:MAG: ABC transporter permease [Anaerolineales bacterium]|nr:ABC transporter permease [Anaerolineales bacterium]
MKLTSGLKLQAHAAPPEGALGDETASPDRSTAAARPGMQRMVQLSSLPLLAFFILPLLALLLRTSPGQWLANLAQPNVLQAVGLSLTTTLLTTGLTILLGTPLAFAMARDLLPFRRVVDSLIDLPTVLPPAVAGIALLMTFGRRGVFGGWLDSLDIHIAFTPFAVVLAQMFVAAPFYVKAASLGFASLDRQLEQAAGLDGASGWQTFRYVILPLSWAALLSGSVMTWARALGEFGATIIFAGNYVGRTQTMPLAIYLGFEINLEAALTLSVVLIGTSFLALMVVKWVLHREWL